MAFLLLLPCIPAIKECLDNPLCNAMAKCADDCSDCGTDMEMGMLKISRKFRHRTGHKRQNNINHEEKTKPIENVSLIEKFKQLQDKKPSTQAMK